MGMRSPNNMSWRSGLIFMAVAGMFLAGCDDTQPAPDATSPKVTSRPSAAKFVAFVAAGNADPIWPVLKGSAQRYAQELGTREVRYFVPDGNSPQDQIRLVQSLNDPQM